MMKKTNEKPQIITRRKFIGNSITGFAVLGLSTLSFSGLVAAKKGNNKKLGIALVGLGNYAESQLAPALLETENCYLAGIVTGTKSKETQWQQKYNIPDKNVYNYDNFDDIAHNDDIDIVYVVLPNSMHAEYSIRAAKAGKHVISEKPMAVSVAECQQVIDACKNQGVKLGIGYRLHYEPHNLEMMRLGQNQVYGKVNSMQANFSFKMGDLSQWRADKKYSGGGPLMDIGLYCIQGAIYTLGELPISVSARDTTVNRAAWKTVEGSLEWTFKFKSGAVVNSVSSYEQDYQDSLVATANKGKFGLGPAYMYDGLKGFTPDGNMPFNTVYEQVLQMDSFATSVLNNTDVLVPGEMGMRDMYIVEKIYQSMQLGGKELSLADMPDILHKV